MNKQKGFTLVEMMIAGIIGIFLMASLMNLFVTTNKSVGLSDAISKNQESGRFALEYMTRYIRLSGYSEDFTTSPPPILIPDPSPAVIFKCSLGISCSENNAANAHGDRLAIPYVVFKSDQFRSCSGTVIGANQPDPAPGQLPTPLHVADVFWVSNAAQNNFELVCQSFDPQNNVPIDDQPVSIISGVESFEFQIGIALQENQRDAGRYINVETFQSSDPNTGDPYTVNQVRSIRIALLTSSRDELSPNKLKTDTKKRDYAVLDGPSVPTEDANLRQIFSTTIELPNLIESAIWN
jgi:type IV pilus assembly protein PilW